MTSSDSKQLRWGILGTGWIARKFTSDLVLTDHSVTAVGSRGHESAASFAAEFGIARVHPSYEELVADGEVDIVYVATPHTRHHHDARLALAAGKHALVEKPFTINATEARDLAEFAAARGLLVLEAMWTRWLPHMVRLKQLVDGGVIGDIRSVLVDHTQRLSDDPAHRINAIELGGGALLDLGVYPVSFASQLLGIPESIEATATFKETGADAETGILLHCAGGRTATLYTASTTAGPNVATVIGRDGWISVDPIWYGATSFSVYDPNGGLVDRFDGRVAGRGMQFQAEEAERLVAMGRITGDVLPISETVSIMETLDRVRELIGLRYPGE
jgi:predicted dehydrogenase